MPGQAGGRARVIRVWVSYCGPWESRCIVVGMSAISCIGLIGLSLAIASAACGSWTDDPAVNTLVSADHVGCVITHTAVAHTGDVWVAWYDSSAGYDVRLQRLDEHGVAAFDPPILISDQSLSWVQDFDLECDAAGNAAIAWASETLIGAVLVEPSGDIAWVHEFGVGSGAFLGSPQVCGTDDGAVVVGWLQDAPSHIQRVESDGTLAWDFEVVLDAGGTTALSDIQPSLDGSVIVSCVHYLSFSGAKRLKAQRISAGGGSMWGLGMVDVFTSGSLQFGAYPSFISDGAGGGRFAWYETSPLLAHVQWIDLNGGAQWGSNGLIATNESSMVHVSPSACIDQSTGETTVFWVRQNSAQSTAGIQANRFNEAGDALWGSAGRQIVAPISTHTILDLQAGQIGSVASAMWIRDAGLSETVLGVGLDAMGVMQWGFGPTSLGVSSGEKTDLSSAGGATQRIATWAQMWDGAFRVFAQNVHQDGTLGPGISCPADVNGDGVVGTDDLLLIIRLWGPCVECESDLNGDGMVGTDDLLALLASWGLC